MKKELERVEAGVNGIVRIKELSNWLYIQRGKDLRIRGT